MLHNIGLHIFSTTFDKLPSTAVATGVENRRSMAKLENPIYWEWSWHLVNWFLPIWFVEFYWKPALLGRTIVVDFFFFTSDINVAKVHDSTKYPALYLTEHWALATNCSRIHRMATNAWSSWSKRWVCLTSQELQIVNLSSLASGNIEKGMQGKSGSGCALLSACCVLPTVKKPQRASWDIKGKLEDRILEMELSIQSNNSRLLQLEERNQELQGDVESKQRQTTEATEEIDKLKRKLRYETATLMHATATLRYATATVRQQWHWLATHLITATMQVICCCAVSLRLRIWPVRHDYCTELLLT